MITNGIPLFKYCPKRLGVSLKKFRLDDDIYDGIRTAIELLDNYYYNVSPMVGIALILDPALKVKFLRTCLGWKEECILLVEENLKSSFTVYKQAAAAVSSSQELDDENDGFADFHNYMKRFRSDETKSEYDWCLLWPPADA